MKLDKLLNPKTIKGIIVLVLCIYIIYNIYYGAKKSMESFKLQDKEGIIDMENFTKKMENKIESYKNIIDKLDNIATDLKS